MPDYAIMTAFNGRDNVSHLFRQMSRSADNYGDTARRAIRGVGREADHASTALRNATKHGYAFGSIVKGILAANALRGGIGLIGSAVQSAGSQFVDFDDTMVRAAIKFDDIGVSARDAASGYKSLRSEVALLKKETLDLIKGTPFSPVDAAKALDTLAASGYLRRGGAIAGLKASMSVATATGEDLPSVVGNLSGMMGSFGLRSKDGVKEAANFRHLGDVMTYAANISNVSIMDLKETMEQIGPISRIMGADLEEVAAQAAILGNASIKGTEGATALKNIMLSLANPDKMEEIRANIGSLTDKAGKMKTVSTLITEVYKKLETVFTGPDAKPKIAGVLNHLFGLRGIAGSKTLADAVREIEDAKAKLKKSGGTADMMAKAAAELSMKIKLAELSNALLTKTFNVLEAFNASGQKGIEGFIAKVSKWDANSLINALSRIGNTMWTMYKIVEPFLPFIPYITAGFIAWKVALAGLAGIKALAAFTEIGWGIGLIEGALGGGGLAAAMWALFAPLAAIVALVPGLLALSSLITGEDNIISRGAQAIGLVPKLAHDAEGHVIGRSNDQYSWTPWDNGTASDVGPNAKEARARTKRDEWKGVLQFGNLPEGSTFNGQPLPNPWVTLNGLGANP